MSQKRSFASNISELMSREISASAQSVKMCRYSGPLGFSLVELIIVIVIIGIIAAIAVPRFSRGTDKAAISTDAASLALLQDAVSRFLAEHPDVTPAIDMLNEDVGGGSVLTHRTLVNGTVDNDGPFGPYRRTIPARQSDPEYWGVIGLRNWGTPNDSNVAWTFNSTTKTVGLGGCQDSANNDTGEPMPDGICDATH